MSTPAAHDTIYDLSGRTALITGGLGGLGLAVTRAFVAAGASVTAVEHQPHPQVAQALQSDLGEASARLTVATADIFEEPAVAALVDQIVAARGRLDIAINLVGGYAAGEPVTELSLETWQSMLELNLRGTFLVSKYAARAMQRQRWGRIITVSSRAAVSGRRNAAAYSIAKQGVLSLTEILAEELRESNITVNALLPSIIDTPANRAAMPKAPHHQWPRAEELARVMLFLASNDAALISGASIPVYGLA